MMSNKFDTLANQPFIQDATLHTTDAAFFSVDPQFTAQFAKRMPFNSATKKPWTHLQINRILVDNYQRAFNPEVPRDVQDLFVLLLKHRTKLRLVRYQLDQLAEEQQEADAGARRLAENGWIL